MDRSSRLLHGQPRHLFERNYFPLLTKRIVLSNKKKFEKIFSRFFWRHFQKKKYSADPFDIVSVLCSTQKHSRFMPVYLIAVYDISFSYLRALSQQIHFFWWLSLLKNFLQLISDTKDECWKITSLYKGFSYFCWKTAFLFSFISFCFINPYMNSSIQ